MTTTWVVAIGEDGSSIRRSPDFVEAGWADQASNLVNPGFAPGLFTTIEPERRRACCSHQKLGALDFGLEDGHEGAASQRSWAAQSS
ncbi:hypothetical protein HPB47_007913 [Ixodes persulcatus]|uniref:Uncharacterized protein n=1 Tax=Ixodes persulcatus TaxID=34615 RepID=A0AC60P631_IXOPE|nr:hypothetical protein HPB47_007913 [Ixodes persulcatus]